MAQVIDSGTKFTLSKGEIKIKNAGMAPMINSKVEFTMSKGVISSPCPNEKIEISQLKEVLERIQLQLEGGKQIIQFHKND